MNKFKKVLAAIMLMTAVFFAAGCGKDDGSNNNGGNDNGGGTNNLEYVDLGLPSGTFWATCNVGANTPEEYGDYFAWGETQPKTTYDWNTYKYANGSYDQLTKYCSNSSYGYNGFTDNLTTLLPEDDASTTNLGSGWRMPTKEQWEELYQNTNSTWTTQNGVNGRLFTASNGNSLFLTAAGYHCDDDLNYVGHDGFYWANLLYTGTDPSCNASWYYRLSPDYSETGFLSRDYGFSVRPVRSAR